MKFLNCQIDLSKWNFRPRVETAYWLKKAVKEIQNVNLKIQNDNSKLKILDIFSGSGCMGVAILENVKNCRVDFIDISRNATEQIKINLKLNKIPAKRYKIYQSDLFKKIGERRYDFIFANPPYVAQERINEVQPSVLKYEPHVALFSGKKGLDAIKKFFKEAKKHLNPAGVVFMEFDSSQKPDIEDILKREKYQSFKFFKDQFTKWRWVKVIPT